MINPTFAMAQANEILGNNVMSSQQQQQKWMDKPLGDPSPLAHLKVLDSLFVNQTVSITECNSIEYESISLFEFVFI